MMIRDHFMVNNGQKTRLYLIKKALKSVEDHIIPSCTHFNKVMNEGALIVATTDLNGNKPNPKVAKQVRRLWIDETEVVLITKTSKEIEMCFLNNWH